ncbi:ATP-binding cassette sub-family F member 2 [Fukomys damarensis]|uniref:ATP-binding cassette sub-family F member 2 n=1 Tax=Fukomys damarensis TaxID=885580 RepID=A0A091DDL4_FUKDA|nr:ATP-binding cassette sub-family F member 2 [Fukomys damarensis]
MELYEHLEDLDAGKAEMRASWILHTLCFTVQQKNLKDFSGGWRMRVALARALFIWPFMLLQDEPNHHLVLDACVWLEEELKTFKHILILVSHSQDFLNGVCTNIIHMHKKLKYYKGNYDQNVKTLLELELNQMKRFHWEQNQIVHMKNYISRYGQVSAKRAWQVQSKEKTLQKMMASELTERIGCYHRHLQEQLDLDVSALEYMMKCFPEMEEKEEMRKIIGQYGLTGKQQNLHMIFLDEPTNHLDMEPIDALAGNINEFEVLMLVSYDFRSIQQVAEEIWVCEEHTITKMIQRHPGLQGIPQVQAGG